MPVAGLKALNGYILAIAGRGTYWLGKVIAMKKQSPIA
jgi:hypothetical protein|tara:strand:- start:254 stop:367 length:114 start_codon:yes stop_codon:yes gene_type:complete